MDLVEGYFDDLGHPRIKFRLRGLDPISPGIELDALFDTGFTAAAQIPRELADFLGLVEKGTLILTVANDTAVTCTTALGELSFCGKSAVGTIVVGLSSDQALVGMDFLTLLKLSFVIRQGKILFFDDNAAVA